MNQRATVSHDAAMAILAETGVDAVYARRWWSGRYGDEREAPVADVLAEASALRAERVRVLAGLDRLHKLNAAAQAVANIELDRLVPR